MNNKKNPRSCLPGVLEWSSCAGLLLWGPLVWAPFAAADGESTSAAPSGLVLDETQVTARHRLEKPQNVPIALSVLDGQQLDDSGLHDLQGIQERIPGLVVSGHNARYAGLGLRGFGATAYNDGLESSVGVFVDGVYLGRSGMAFSDLLDVERVEVLRGPQGTLYGKNTSAGAINIVTRQPTPYLESSAETSLGSHGTREYRGVLSGPLVDEVLMGRLSASQSTRDPEVENLHNGSRLNDQNRQALRGQLLWTPNARFSARLSADRAWQDETGNALLASQYSQETRNRARFMRYTLLPTDPYRRETQQDGLTRTRSQQNGLSLELNWTLDDEHVLTSLSGYRDWRFRNPRDGDGSGLAIAQADSGLDQRQFSQEWRLAGKVNDRLDYVVGLYYLQQHLDRTVDVDFGKDASAWFLGDRPELAAFGVTRPQQIPASLLNGAGQRFDGEQKGDSRAVFGQYTWRPLEPLELTFGLRYTEERKTGWISREVVNLAPLERDPISLVGGQLLRNVALGGSYYRRSTIDEHNVSGLLGLSYRFNEQVLGYASVSRGSKAGGINLDVVSLGVNPTYKAEQATSMEVGVKTQFWNDAARMNLALYQTDVDDYQALTYSRPVDTLSPPLRDNLLNVGAVRLRGIELDFAWRLNERIDLRWGTAWSDARYRDFENAPCPPGSGQWTCNLSGARLYNAPEWNTTAGVDWRYPLEAGLEAYSGLDYSLRSGYQGTLEGGPGSYQPGYGLANLRVGLRDHERSWSVEGWARNLFDKQYITAVYSLLGAGDYGVLPGDPRTVGLTLNVRH
ncbi:TonB-dependent receptor [Pseudomonas mucidolens]|uniref:TonB-dependent receptor n=1 Tax=Pseudomonas mucidolens TaxID=46679 RepID=UPI0030DC1C86